MALCEAKLNQYIVCQINFLVGVQTLVWQNQAKAGRLLFLKAYSISQNHYSIKKPQGASQGAFFY